MGQMLGPEGTPEVLSDSTACAINPPMIAMTIPSEIPMVVAVVYQDMNVFELGVVAEIFGTPRPDFETPLYRLRVAQAEPGELRAVGGLRLRADGGLRLLGQADIVIVPGWRDHRSAPPEALLRALRRAHARGAKLVSICAGAFVLGAAGLLDGLRATTHWRYAQAFQKQFPRVRFDPDVLYVDEGSVLTSAGSAAGIDAGLHLVRTHYGAGVANAVARAMVSNPHRSGGQAQFVPRPVPIHASRPLAALLDWIRHNIDRPISVAALAGQAAMSERTLLRRFVAEVGMAPKAWLVHERVRLAQSLLEQAGSSLDRVAQASGFASPESFRAAFRRVAGVAPSVYRERFNGR